jgi:hypothetical protein
MGAAELQCQIACDEVIETERLAFVRFQSLSVLPALHIRVAQFVSGILRILIIGSFVFRTGTWANNQSQWKCERQREREREMKGLQR